MQLRYNAIVAGLAALLAIALQSVTARAADPPGIWTSPLYDAYYSETADHTLQEDLAYGPSTAYCGYTTVAGVGLQQLGTDPLGGQSTGVRASLNTNGTWHLDMRAVKPGDHIVLQVQCLPFTSFHRGVPVRTGFDGALEYPGSALVTHNAENPWTTVFTPMSLWGSFSDNYNPPSGGEFAGINLCANTSPAGSCSSCGNGACVLSGEAASWTYHSGTTGVQYEGYSWSPSGCSLSLGRTNSGTCIYVPNGQNANVGSITNCDECTVEPLNSSAVGLSCGLSSTCAGSTTPFCVLTQFAGFTPNGGTLTIIGQGSGGPPVLNAFSWSGMPGDWAPKGAMSCIEPDKF